MYCESGGTVIFWKTVLGSVRINHLVGVLFCFFVVVVVACFVFLWFKESGEEASWHMLVLQRESACRL